MFIKFCESQHNLAKGCPTIALGTLQLYADDNPDFLRHDFKEGYFEVKNEGAAVQMDGKSFETLSAGSIRNAQSVYLAPGSRFTSKFQFPNCYMFCFSQDLVPSEKVAQDINPGYDDWYLIHDLQSFITYTAELLLKQLKLSDLEISTDVSVAWMRGLNLEIVHRACSFEGREVIFDQDSVGDAIQVADDPLRWAFSKDLKHNVTKEYRVMFILQDHRGNVVPVKQSLKLLNLQPEIGVSIYG